MKKRNIEMEQNLSKEELIWRKQIIEMVDDLLSVSTDTYMSFKQMVLADASLHGTPGLIKFIKDLFAYTDKHRPLAIEMH